MLVFPAIDLKDGKVVRLYKGDFKTVHQVADDPVAIARMFQEADAKYVHMVDLDGARNGVRTNGYAVQKVCDTGLKVELGGGIRSMADLEEVFAMGIWRAVIGSAAVTTPDFVRQAIDRYGAQRIAVGIDAKDGKVRTSGWEADSGLDYLEFAKKMEEIGVKSIIFTDIDTDGMQSGPAFEKLEKLKQTVTCAVTASGGVSCNEDVCALQACGMDAVIIGKAWYAGAIDLKQAVTDAGAQQ